MSQVAEKSNQNGMDIVRAEINPEILDLAHLARYTGGDVDLESELMGLFKLQAEQQISVILAANDKDEWAMAVHTLKGSAQGIGAVRLGETARKLEDVPFVGHESEKLAVLTELQLDMDKCLKAVDCFIHAAEKHG